MNEKDAWNTTGYIPNLDGTFLSVCDDKMAERLASGRAIGISINTSHGFSGDNIEFIRNFQSIQRVKMPYSENIDPSPLYDLELLNYLLIKTKHKIDLTRMPKLTHLQANYSCITNTSTSIVCDLAVWKFKSKYSNMTDFPSFNQLLNLELVQSNIENLLGLEKFAFLTKLELFYNSKLQSLFGIDNSKLSDLRIHDSKKLTNYAPLDFCSNLEELNLHRCGTIPNLKFVKKLSLLKSFRFMDTDVADGDMSPLVNLDDTLFTDKRHFSHRHTQFKQRRSKYLKAPIQSDNPNS